MVKCCVLGAALLIACGAWAQEAPGSAPKPAAHAEGPAWKSLFDGKTLDGWKETPFTGRGKVTLRDGAILLNSGSPFTGISLTREFPNTNYEIRLLAARFDGMDFFAAITFPVGDSFCTWVNGGWGGSIVGLSSLDDMDASSNETTTMHSFAQGRWYRLQLRVTDWDVTAWIDGEQALWIRRDQHDITLRPGDIGMSAPFGIASYNTLGALKNIEFRELPTAATE